MMFQQVDPFSFLFRKDLPTQGPVFWAAAFPPAWAAELRQAAALQKRPSFSAVWRLRQARESRLSLSSLHRAIRAFFPQVMAIGGPNLEATSGDDLKADGSGGAAASPGFWLLSRERIAPQNLCVLVRVWFEAEYPQSHSLELKPDDLRWEPCHLSPPTWKIAANGTACLSTWEVTHLWPQYLSLLVAGKECRLDSQKEEKKEKGKKEPSQIITETVRFRRYIAAPGESGAALVSWPPLCHRDDYFSLYLRLCLRTVPFLSQPRLYCRAGIRRWVRPGTNVRLPWQENTTVVLVPPVPPPGVTGGPLPGEERAKWAAGMALTTTRVERRRGEGKSENWQWDWSGAVASILESRILDSWQDFPVPEAFCSSPPPFEEFPCQWLPALVYREGILPKNRIQPGLNPSHRRQLMDWLAGVWQPWLEPEAPFPRCSHVLSPARCDWEKAPAANVSRPDATESKTRAPGVPDSGGHEAAAGGEDSGPEENSGLSSSRFRPDCLLRALGRTGDLELWLELYWQTNDMLACVPSVVAHILAPSSPGEGRVTIRLAPKPLGVLGVSPAMPEVGGRNQWEREVEATLLASPTPLSPDIPVLALIELPGRKHFLGNRGNQQMPPDSDPKNLLRRVFARHGRLTQFIEPAVPLDEKKQPKKTEKELIERIRHALLDLFRQMGVSLTLSPPPLPNRNLTTVGVWLPSRPTPAGRKNMSGKKEGTFSSPLWVRIDSGSQQVTVWLRGKDGRECWQPYWKALLELARIPDKVLPWLDSPADVTGRLENFVTTHLGRNPNDVLLLAVAQNIRHVWPGLKNELLFPDKLCFSAGRYPLDARECPRLRVVRLRTHENDETPEWVARRIPLREQSGQWLFSVSETEVEETDPVSLSGDSWASGVFRLGDTSHTDGQPAPNARRVLFSIQESPVQHSRRKYPRPLHKGGWNPQMLEMTFILLPGNEAEVVGWGMWIHRLREKSVQSTGPTILPLPLHLAQLMEEYLLDETD